MRISTATMSAMMLGNISESQTKLVDLQEQINNRKRVNRPSDDPIASARLIQLQRDQAEIKQYQKNNEVLKNSYQGQEAIIKGIKQELSIVGIRLTEAANGSNRDNAMLGFGEELSSIADSLFAQLNAKNADERYLFAGTKNDTPPVLYNDTSKTYRYVGNKKTRASGVANGVNLKENTLLSGVFSTVGSDDMAVLTKLKQLSEDMKNPAIPKVVYEDKIRELLGLIRETENGVFRTEGDLGGRINRLDLLSEGQKARINSNELLATSLGGMDDIEFAKAASQLKLFQDAMEGSLLTYIKINSISIFNYM